MTAENPRENEGNIHVGGRYITDITFAHLHAKPSFSLSRAISIPEYIFDFLFSALATQESKVRRDRTISRLTKAFGKLPDRLIANGHYAEQEDINFRWQSQKAPFLTKGSRIEMAQ